MAPSAVRALKKSPPDVVTRVREALEKLARDIAEPGPVRGKTVKTIAERAIRSTDCASVTTG